MGGFESFEKRIMNKLETLLKMRHEGKGRVNDDGWVSFVSAIVYLRGFF